MQTVQAINLIAVSPDIRSGRPHIVGSTVTVSDVAVAHLYHRQDADGIAEWYGLGLAQVYAALAYYYDHKAEIDQQIRATILQSESMKEQRVGGKNTLLS